MSAIKKMMMVAGGEEPIVYPDGAWALANAYPSAVYDYDIGNAAYVQTLSVRTNEANPEAIFFKPDGTKLYYTGQTSDDVWEIPLSTAWDISTGGTAVSFDLPANSGPANPCALTFSSDGTKFYVGTNNAGTVYQFEMTTPWSIASASYSKSATTNANDVASLSFKPDGTRLYIAAGATDDLCAIDLTTAWDLGNTSNVSVNTDIGLYESNLQGIFVHPDGDRMFYTGASGDNVEQTNLTTAWDVSSSSTNFPPAVEFDISGEETTPRDLYMTSTRLYVIGKASDEINQYDHSYIVDMQSFGHSPTGGEAFLQFNDDGTKAFFVSTSAQLYISRNLSTAYNLSTQTADTTYDFSGVGTGILRFGRFSPDGTKFYSCYIGVPDTLVEFTLSTAWDISSSSMSVNQTRNVNTDGLTLPSDIYVKPDGKTIFVVDAADDNVHEFSLSTAFTLSSASYVGNYSITGMANIMSIDFKGDGSKVFLINHIDDVVKEFDLATNWDLSSTQTLVTTFSGVAEIQQTHRFKSDGSAYYLSDNYGKLRVYSVDENG